MRLIDADVLWEQIAQAKPNDALALIEDAPTVDAVKHGHWVAHDMSIKDVPTEACSECYEWSYGYNEPYCQKCGAKMDG